MFIYQFVKILRREGVVCSLAYTDVQVDLIAEHAPWKCYLNEFQIGSDDVIAIFQIHTTGCDV